MGITVIYVTYPVLLCTDWNFSYLNTMISRIEKFADWSNLKKIRDEMKFIKSIYIWLIIVPIFSKALSKVNETLSLEIFDHTFVIVFKLPFSWKVFFFSALSFVIGNVIYMFQCPKIIKENLDYSMFKNSGRNSNHLFDYAKEIEMHMNKADLGDDTVANNFWHIWEKSDTCRNRSRCLAMSAFIVGIILILFVLVQNIYTVACVIS